MNDGRPPSEAHLEKLSSRLGDQTNVGKILETILGSIHYDAKMAKRAGVSLACGVK